ncbi:MAG: hypothetical protein LBU87_02210 [Lactobacillales bacterium]|jgi:hypothetical protein|nr:hypothetical protein [Lactobacillales bacterium]
MKKYVGLLIGLLFVSACIHTPPAPEGFEEKTVETEHFSIKIWEKEGIEPKKMLRVYIAGDGNPTPKNPVGLALAEKDTYQNVIYISRPCQYESDNDLCKKQNIYGADRYHREIIKEMQELVVYLIRKHKSTSLELVGYDGGAPIALLLATRIPAQRVITVAGILDTQNYNKQHNLPQGDGLNPADEKNLLRVVPQIHYVGEDDTLTTKRMAERFVARLQNPKSAVVKIVPDTAHTDWEEVEFDYY